MALILRWMVMSVGRGLLNASPSIKDTSSEGR